MSNALKIQQIRSEMDGAIESALWEYAPKKEIEELISMIEPDLISIGWTPVTTGLGPRIVKIYPEEQDAVRNSPIYKAKEVFVKPVEEKCNCDRYSPDIQAQGDCRNCGHAYDSHIL